MPWRVDIEHDCRTETEGRVFAQVWNLESEKRIPTKRAEFLAELETCHETRIGAHEAPAAAARAALEEMIRSTKSVDSPWLGLLPVPDSSGGHQVVFTHLTATDAAKLDPVGPFNPDDPPPRVSRFARLPWLRSDGMEKRFNWVAFEPSGAAPSMDPGLVVRELGLAHYRRDAYVYRIEFSVDLSTCFIPTCLDAGLSEAWAPPRPGAPFGETRDLVTGESKKPELLVEVKNTSHLQPGGVLVSPPGTRRKVGPIAADFRANRP